MTKRLGLEQPSKSKKLQMERLSNAFDNAKTNEDKHKIFKKWQKFMKFYKGKST